MDQKSNFGWGSTQTPLVGELTALDPQTFLLDLRGPTSKGEGRGVLWSPKNP